jgi:hypothetical protein
MILIVQCLLFSLSWILFCGRRSEVATPPWLSRQGATDPFFGGFAPKIPTTSTDPQREWEIPSHHFLLGGFSTIHRKMGGL